MEDEKYNFKPRIDRRSYYWKSGVKTGQMKDWPDEWVCRNCSNSKLYKDNKPRKYVWCCGWKKMMWHNSDRACFEEPIEMMEERHAMGKKSEKYG